MDTPRDERERIIDEEHLRLLSIACYIAGGLHIAFASIFIFHFVFLVVFASHPGMMSPAPQGRGGPPEAMFYVFAWGLGIVILLGWLFGGMTIYAGRCIKARSRRAFSMVMAALNTLAMPVGTIVGVCGLMVLSRASVKQRYEDGLP
jgi:hypothetical protein